jgi:alanyl-tRNA synthetase
MFTVDQVRRKFLDYYLSRGHCEIPPASLIPQNDSTTLFTSSGMQQLVPYLLGEAHPLGTRLVNSQPCFRSQDIEEVGDSRHTTFFEMLGNWSLGDYSREEQLPWVFGFITEELGLEPDRLWVSVCSGGAGVPTDERSAQIWRELGVASQRIVGYGTDKNWWSRAGEPDAMPPGEPGGPDSEMFYEFPDVVHDPAFGPECHPNCDCGRFLEIGNSVFMEYRKTTEGLVKLPSPNVDFGGGLERLTAARGNHPDVFHVDVFRCLTEWVEDSSGRRYEDCQRSMRIVADHLRSAVQLLQAGVIGSNKTQGYVVRRLLRRSMRHGRLLGLQPGFLTELASSVLGFTSPALYSEESKFERLLSDGLKEVDKIKQLTGAVAFRLYETHGFPLEMSEEIAVERGQRLDPDEFRREFEKHRELSRSGSAGMFKSGLADHSESVVKLHTATHLLHQSLREVLGPHVQQKGSNITAERLRFDFAHDQPLSAAELEQVQTLVNRHIRADLPVTTEVSGYQEALASGALAFFGERYPERVSVYSIGHFSKEICSGPHVQQTGVLGTFRVEKQTAVSAGVRRIYAKLE